MSERVITYGLKDLPDCLTSRIPKRSGMWSSVFYLAREGSSIAQVFDDVPEPAVDFQEPDPTVAFLVAQAAVYAGLEETLLGKDASLDRPQVGFHAGKPGHVHAWLRKNGYVEAPVRELLDRIMFVVLEGSRPRKLFSVRQGVGTRLHHLADGLWMLPRPDSAQFLVAEEGWVRVEPRPVVTTPLTEFGCEGEALAGTLSVLGSACDLVLKAGGPVIRGLRKQLAARTRQLEAARRGSREDVASAREAARPWVDNQGQWEDALGASSWSLWEAYRAVEQPIAESRAPEMAAIWQAIYRRCGKTGWPKPLSGKSLEHFEVGFDHLWLPDDLKASMALHDGERKGKARTVPPHRLLSLDEAMALLLNAERGKDKSVYGQWAKKRGGWFLPLTTVESGFGYVLDMPEGQAKGVLAVYGHRANEVAKSFAQWLKNVSGGRTKTG